jgi:hypothetical protein
VLDRSNCGSECSSGMEEEEVVLLPSSSPCFSPELAQIRQYQLSDSAQRGMRSFTTLRSENPEVAGAFSSSFFFSRPLQAR